jgi:FkbM family methyltransferase
MRQWLFDLTNALPRFRGHGRLLKWVRDSCYRPYVGRVDGSLRLELDLYEWNQLELAGGTFTEPLTIALMRRLLKPGDVFVDVGAHVGIMTLAARQQVGPSGLVVAIEPQPYNCERLLRNWAVNDFSNLRLLVAAAGSSAGTVTLPQQSCTDKARLSLAMPMPDATELTFSVPLVRLSDVLQDVPQVRVLKIDVEGYELEVLRGLGEAHRKIDNLIFEMLPEAGSSPAGETSLRDELIGWCTTAGYQVRTVTGEPWTRHDPLPEANVWATRQAGQIHPFQEVDGL